jgi:hypothetical protein
MLSTGPGPIAVGASAHDATQMPAVDAPEFVGEGEGVAEVPVLGAVAELDGDGEVPVPDGDGDEDAGELARPAGAGLDPIVEPAAHALRTPAPSRIAK